MDDDEFMEKKSVAKSGGGSKPAKVLKKDKYDALMIVMDCGTEMSKEEFDGRTSFQLGQEAIDWILSRKIFTHSKDRANIVLFGTDDENNTLDAPNVVVRDEDFLAVNFDHVRFILNEVALSKNKSDVISALLVAVDTIRAHVDGKPQVEGKSILLITNGQAEAADVARIKSLATAINALGINLVVMGVDERRSSEENSVSPLLDLVEKVEGTVYTFSEACSALQHFTQSTVASRAIRKNWEIAPGVRLPLAMYTKTVAAKNPLKAVLIDESGEQMKRQHQLLVKEREDVITSKTEDGELPQPKTNYDPSTDESYKVVDKTETVYGYAFGRSKVAIAAEDEVMFNNHNFNEGEERGCMKLIQFTKKDNILRSYFVGRNSFTVVPGWEKKTSARDMYLMRTTLSIIQGMLEEDVVAVCRYASDASKHLQLMALIPQKDEKGLLYMTALRLPFIDDWRPFSLPDIHKKGPAPTDVQLSLVDDLIDAMDLEKTDVDYDHVLNPYFQRQCTMMKIMALNNLQPGFDSKVAELVPPSTFLKRELEPDPTLRERAQRVLDVFLDEKDTTGFRLEPVVKMKRAKREFVPDRKNHLKGQFDEAEDAKDVGHGQQPSPSKVKDVESKMLRLVKQAVDEGGSKLEQFLSGLAMQLSLWDGVNEQPISGFLATRARCISAQRWKEFNNWLFDMQGDPDYTDFFQYMDSQNHPSLITFDDCVYSPYTATDSQMYWTGIVVKKEEQPFEDEEFDFDQLPD